MLTTKHKLEDILHKAGHWPAEDKRDLIAYALSIEARQGDVYKLSYTERSAIEEGLAEADAGEFASNQELNRAGARQAI